MSSAHNVVRVTRGVSQVEQELFILPEHMRWSPCLSGVLVALSVYYFGDHCLSFWPFSFDLCIVFYLIYSLFSLHTRYNTSYVTAVLWSSLCTLVSLTNKTDCKDIIEILLKVALDTTNLLICTCLINLSLLSTLIYDWDKFRWIHWCLFCNARL